MFCKASGHFEDGKLMPCRPMILVSMNRRGVGKAKEGICVKDIVAEEIAAAPHD